VRSLRNTEYWVMAPDGQVRRSLGDALELRDVLREELGVDVSPAEAERLFAAAQSAS
jgi:hypothetical protein